MLLNNEQRKFIESVNDTKEWANIIQELQSYMGEEELISVYAGNDRIEIEKNSILKNNCIVDLSSFSFYDFEKMYIGFLENETK